MWRGRLRKQYSDFEEFQAYSETYGLAERLGYDTPEEAWEDNPMVQGGVRPEDFRKVCPKGSRWNEGKSSCIPRRR
jgi:hypothetical protein